MTGGESGRAEISRAPQPSFVRLPDQPKFPCTTVYEFLVQHFAHLAPGTWEQRIEDGEVLDPAGNAVTRDTPYQAGLRVSYYRSVRLPQASPTIPILFEDDEILVADKPHGISVTPGGNEVGGCLLYLLWDRSPERTLTPVHRIDRDTAGLVLFVKRAEDRGVWQQCFARGDVEKLYFASSIVQLPLETHYWRLQSRISADPQTQTPEALRNGPNRPAIRRWSRPSSNPNACSEIYYAGGESAVETDREVTIGRFWIRPRTGKQHQIRLHLASLGFPILGDSRYGRSSRHPLQLQSAELLLAHPRTGRRLRFRSARSLAHWTEIRTDTP